MSQNIIATDNEYNSQKSEFQFSSIQFNGYFVMGNFKGTSADYKANTKTQIQQKRVQIPKKLNWKNKNIMTRKRAKNINSEKIIWYKITTD